MVKIFNWKVFLPTVALLLTLAFIPAPSFASVATTTINDKTCEHFRNAGQELPAGCDPAGKKLISDDPNNPDKGYIPTLVNGFIYAAGVVALIFLLIGAIRYITASGDSGRIKQAKDTVLYSIIGLIVVALAIPIADFVIEKLA